MFLAERSDGNQPGSDDPVTRAVGSGEGNAMLNGAEVGQFTGGVEPNGERVTRAQGLLACGGATGLYICTVGAPDQGSAAQGTVFRIGSVSLQGDLVIPAVCIAAVEVYNQVGRGLVMLAVGGLLVQATTVMVRVSVAERVCGAGASSVACTVMV